MALINVDITGAVCRLCSLPFTDLIQMRTHAVQHGYVINARYPDGVIPFVLDKNNWRCITCYEEFNNYLKLYEHMNVHYQHYICATCGKGYMTAPRLRKHSEVHVSGTFSCDACGKVFTSKSTWEYHKAHAHAKIPRYECPKCDMRFEGYYERMNHLNITHREKKVSYKCPHCELAFKTSSKRSSHVKAIHFPPQRDFACSNCEWNFKSMHELKRHMVKHSGERNFECTICGKSFPRSKSLREHLLTHDSLRCKWCGCEFKQKCKLLKHLRFNHSESGQFGENEKTLKSNDILG